MADTGWITASSAANEVINASYGSWSSPTNALTSNNADATVNVRVGNPVALAHWSNWLKLTNYGPGVPSNHTITLLEVEIEGAASAASATYIESIVAVLGGTTGSDTPAALDTSTFSTSDTTKVSTYSEAQCLALFTPAIVNATGFGIAVQVRGTGSGSIAFRDVDIDAVRIRITHEPPPAQPASSQHARRRRT